MPHIPPTNYTDRIPWYSVRNHGASRPYVTVTIHGDNGLVFPEWGLIDTGADYLVIPYSVAHYLGLNTTHSPRKLFSTAGGNQIQLPFRQVYVTFSTLRLKVMLPIQVYALIGTPQCPMFRTPIIGLETINKAMDFGIDLQGWLYR